MSVTNKKIKSHEFLTGMYRDDYFPNFLVDKIKDILISLCINIETQNPQDEDALLKLTHAATEQINRLQEEFGENDSELETGAREDIGENFEFIVRAYGYDSVDLEDVTANREY